MSWRYSTDALAEEARKRYALAEAAVRVGLIGPDLVDPKSNAMHDVKVLPGLLTRALSAYLTINCLETSQRALAEALTTNPERVRMWCRFVEAWRAAPLINEAIERVEKTLPRSL